MPPKIAALTGFVPTIGGLSETAELLRIKASRTADTDHKANLGQFLTPMPVARFMASMAEQPARHVRLLDAGAGVGSLLAAAVERFCNLATHPTSISVVAYEIDAILCEYLRDTIRACKAACDQAEITFLGEVRHADFLESADDLVGPGLFDAGKAERFNFAIQNPPYYKINAGSRNRRVLQRLGIETSNIYTGFLAVTAMLLEEGGELIAITPRSFCNGSYFRAFRQSFLKSMTLRQIHCFDSRQQAFKDDSVLQETVIFRAAKGARHEPIEITSNSGPDDTMVTTRTAPYHQVVRPNDPECFIRIQTDDLAARISTAYEEFQATLVDLGINVSTGRVVDFRASESLRRTPEPGTVPLIYPTHFDRGCIEWPKLNGKKPNAIVNSRSTQDLLVPNATYVLVKRFSAKEEKRRIVAAVYRGDEVDVPTVGFENHLNYFHKNGGGLPLDLAKGLAALLNSTIIDQYFRQFSGHTQVNATDLRSMRYPTREQLELIGARLPSAFADQDAIDKLINEELLAMPADADPVKAMKRIDEAVQILRDLGLPRAQLNDRSAMTLLSLLDLKPSSKWSEASDPHRGITPMMAFFREHCGKDYKPNTRETVRRQTVHQFMDAGLIVINPDDPDRPINSPKAVYQITPEALEMLRTYGTAKWTRRLRTYLTSVETLKKRYAQQREMVRIPIKVAAGKQITLSPGGQNVLVQHIIEDFCPRFTPGGLVIYVGDTEEKFAYFDQTALEDLGVSIEAHGKMPDVIVHYVDKNWLVLIEAVTSHGSVNPKRKAELMKMFKDAKAGIVYVTAFLSRKAKLEYLNDISWETEVWVADSPTHMIHFNGERFLGPY
jgi:adenine-specific DNA-methyltransferase